MSIEMESASGHAATLSENPPALTLGPLKFHDDGVLRVGPQFFSYAEPIEVTYRGYQVSRRRGSAVTTVTTPANDRQQFQYLAASGQWQQREERDSLRSIAERCFRRFDEYLAKHSFLVVFAYTFVYLYVMYVCGVVLSIVAGALIANHCQLEDLRAPVLLALGLPVITAIYFGSVLTSASHSKRKGLITHVLDDVLVACVKLIFVFWLLAIANGPIIKESLTVAPATWWHVIQYLASSLGMG